MCRLRGGGACVQTSERAGPVCGALELGRWKLEEGKGLDTGVPLWSLCPVGDLGPSRGPFMLSAQGRSLTSISLPQTPEGRCSDSVGCCGTAILAQRRCSKVHHHLGFFV